MYYLQSRYYDSDTGRFINADGYISTGTGLLGYNMYAYCNNNPVMYVDRRGDSPWGLVAICFFISGIWGMCISTLLSDVQEVPSKTESMYDDNTQHGEYHVMYTEVFSDLLYEIPTSGSIDAGLYQENINISETIKVRVDILNLETEIGYSGISFGAYLADVATTQMITINEKETKFKVGVVFGVGFGVDMGQTKEINLALGIGFKISWD